MNTNYTKAYKEVIEILKQISDNDRGKIPNEIYQALEDKMDKNHVFKFDRYKNFEEQELLQETKAILAIFYRDYWATPEIKAKILAKQTNELIKIEQEKNLKNNLVVFKNKTEKSKIATEEPKLEMVIYQEEKWYDKFIIYIKNIFSKKRDN